MMDTAPPANKMQQVHGVTAQSGVREAADVLTIQKMIDPFDCAAGLYLDDMKRTSRAAVGVMDYLKGPGRAASRRRRNCCALPP
jgi:hypothetical protein